MHTTKLLHKTSKCVIFSQFFFLKNSIHDDLNLFEKTLTFLFWRSCCTYSYGPNKQILCFLYNKKHLAKYALISTLKSSRPEARAHLIGYLNDSGIKLLSEVVLMCCLIIFHCPNEKEVGWGKCIKVKRGLSKNIGKKHNSIKRRKRLLQQHGSNLGPLLSIAANSLSGQLFGHN